jgi:hypothetical protein
MDDGNPDPNSLESAINSTTTPQPSTSSRSMGQLSYLHGGIHDGDLVSSHGGRLSETLDTTTGAEGKRSHLQVIQESLARYPAKLDTHKNKFVYQSLNAPKLSQMP